MCIIIHATSKSVLTEESLLQCSEQHSDGVGIMYFNSKGELVVNKSKDSRDYKHILETVPEGVEFGMHFRYKTHGNVTTKNTHPFKLSSEVAFMHNGMLSGYGKGKISDTRDLANQLRTCFRYSSGEDEIITIAEWLRYEAESYNKFLLAHNGEFMRFGKWDTETDEACYSSDPYPLRYYSRYNGYYDLRNGREEWSGSSYSNGGSYFPQKSSIQVRNKAGEYVDIDDLDFENLDLEENTGKKFTFPWEKEQTTILKWVKENPSLAALLLEEISDQYFIDEETMSGFEDFAEYYQEKKEEYLAKKAGTSEDDIREIDTPRGLIIPAEIMPEVSEK